MEYKFGEFDCVVELNAAAQGFLEEGDLESLQGLAAENGIEEYDVADYAAGEMPCLATEFSAAVGKLAVERVSWLDKSRMERMALRVIGDTVSSMLHDSEELVRAIMKKGKRVQGIYDAMRDSAMKRRKGNEAAVSAGTDRQLQQIVRAYYLGTDADLTAKLEDLYAEV